MQVTDRYRQGVGGVIRAWDFLQIQQHAPHMLHLVFNGPALAPPPLFDLQRGVFGNRDFSLRQRQQHHAAPLPYAERRSHIACKKQLLHRAPLRAMEKQNVR